MSWRRKDALHSGREHSKSTSPGVSNDDSTLGRTESSTGGSIKEKGGFLSIFRWFRKGKEEVEMPVKPVIEAVSPTLSHRSTHSSNGSINTLVSTASSFAVLPVTSYRGPTEGQKRSLAGFSDETYRKGARDERKLSLKSKYHLASCESLPIESSDDDFPRPRSGAGFSPFSSLRRKKRRAPPPPAAPNAKRESGGSYNDLSLPSTLESHNKSNHILNITPVTSLGHKRSSSDSGGDKKGHCHVKGKRKAPPPPPGATASDSESPRSLIRGHRLSKSSSGSFGKKKAAPQPPKENKEIQADWSPGKSHLSGEQRRMLIDNISRLKAHAYRRSMGSPEFARRNEDDDTSEDEKESFSNDSLKLERGMLKHAKELSKVESKDKEENKATLSPRPWYKRNANNSKSKTLEKKKEEPWMPEVGVPRVGIAAAEEDNRRKSAVSMLATFSEIDREALEIVQKEQERIRAAREAENERYYISPDTGVVREVNGNVNFETNLNSDLDSPSKPQSAKELISFFNSFNVSKIVINTSLYPCQQNGRSPLANGRRRIASDSSDSDDDISEWIAKFEKKEEVKAIEYKPVTPPSSKSQSIYEYNRQNRHNSPSPSIPTIAETSESSSSVGTPVSTLDDPTKSFVPLGPIQETSKEAEAVSSANRNWECCRCTLINPWWSPICDACYTRKEPATGQISKPEPKNWEAEMKRYFPPSGSDEAKNLIQTKDMDVKEKATVFQTSGSPFAFDMKAEEEKQKPRILDVSRSDVMQKVLALEARVNQVAAQKEMEQLEGEKGPSSPVQQKKDVGESKSSQTVASIVKCRPQSPLEASPGVKSKFPSTFIGGKLQDMKQVEASAQVATKSEADAQPTAISANVEPQSPGESRSAVKNFPSTFIGGKLPQDLKKELLKGDTQGTTREEEDSPQNEDGINKPATEDVSKKPTVEEMRQARLLYFNKAKPDEKENELSDSSATEAQKPKTPTENISQMTSAVMITLGKLEKLESKINVSMALRREASARHQLQQSKSSSSITSQTKETQVNVSKVMSVRPKEPSAIVKKPSSPKLASGVQKEGSESGKVEQAESCKSVVTSLLPMNNSVPFIPQPGTVPTADSSPKTRTGRFGKGIAVVTEGLSELLDKVGLRNSASMSSVPDMELKKGAQARPKSTFINQGPQEHIYENLKDRSFLAERPEKVSTSAQTSAVLRKAPKDSEEDQLNLKSGVLYTSLTKTGTFELIGAKDFATRTGARSKAGRSQKPISPTCSPSQSDTHNSSPQSQVKAPSVDSAVGSQQFETPPQSPAKLPPKSPVPKNQRKRFSNNFAPEKNATGQVHYPTVQPAQKELFEFSKARNGHRDDPPQLFGGNPSYFAYLKEVDKLAAQLSGPKGLADFKANLQAAPMLNNTNTLAVNKLLKKLEAAIAGGQHQEAAVMAQELALLKIQCSVTRFKDGESRILQEGPKPIKVDMFVEDKVSHHGPIPIQVTSCMTVGQLKQKVEQDWEIPTNVQRWILGRQLATDDSRTLSSYSVDSDHCPVFLYLVAPEPVPEEAPVVTTTQEVENSVSKSPPPKPAPSPLRKGLYYNFEEDRYSYCDSSSASSASTREPTPQKDGSAENQEEIKSAAPNGTGSMTNADEKPSGVIEDKEEEEEEEEESEEEEVLGWMCEVCTLVNEPTRPGCEACAADRPANYKIPAGYQLTEAEQERAQREAKQEQELEQVIIAEQENHEAERYENFLRMVDLENNDIIPNQERIECPICFNVVPPQTGVVLRECLHNFCRDCLIHTIAYSEEAQVKCPYRDADYACDGVLQDREIKAVVPEDVYEQHLAKSITEAENKIQNAFHCKTPDCRGWCIYEDNVNEFECPVCLFTNCLTCQSIHHGMNCKEYQEKMQREAASNEDARRTREMIEEMLHRGEALPCPTCQVVLLKKWGCDWVRCSMCKTEICWVTKGPRWGPAGKGDTSAGCKCGINGIKCHPNCNYCH